MGADLPATLERLEGLSPEALERALADLDSKPISDAEAHQRIGALAESIGDLKRAVLEYNLALRDDPDRVDILWHLAELRLDQGDETRAVRCLRRIVELRPQDERARRELDRARGTDRHPPVEPTSPGVPTDAECLALVSAFAGREGVYARQWASPTGKAGYAPVHSPFTVDVARRHLMGAETVGIYTLRSDASVRWLCLDVDITKASLRKARTRGAFEALQRQAQAVACQLVDVAASVGLEALVEDSGNKGRHVWILFESWVPAAAVRRLGRRLTGRLDDVPKAISVEVFPKQTRPPRGDGLGNLVKLPLGVHRLTERWCPFVRPDGTPHPAPFRLLNEVRRVSSDVVLELCKGADVEPRAAPPATPRFAKLPAIAANYSLEHDEEVATIRRGCAVLDGIIAQAKSTRILDPQARKVLTYTLGHVTHGADAVNTVLESALNVDASLYLKRPLRGHPMSCPKIRKHVPSTSLRVGCDCVFDHTASYPHPLVHLQALNTERTEPATFEDDPEPPEAVGARWLALSKKHRELASQLEALEAEVRELARAHGSITVDGTELRATDDGLEVVEEPGQ